MHHGLMHAASLDVVVSRAADSGILGIIVGILYSGLDRSEVAKLRILVDIHQGASEGGWGCIEPRSWVLGLGS